MTAEVIVLPVKKNTDMCPGAEPADETADPLGYVLELEQENLDLRSALAEAELRTLRLSRGRRQRTRVVGFVALAMLIGTLTVLPSGENAVAAPKSPLVFFSAEMLTPKAEPGGEIIIQVIKQKLRACPTTMTRRIRRLTDGVRVAHETIAVGAEPNASPVTLKIARQLPAELKDGRYAATATFVANCAGRTFTIEQPEVTFEVARGQA